MLKFAGSTLIVERIVIHAIGGLLKHMNEYRQLILLRKYCKLSSYYKIDCIKYLLINSNPSFVLAFYNNNDIDHLVCSPTIN